MAGKQLSLMRVYRSIRPVDFPLGKRNELASSLVVVKERPMDAERITLLNGTAPKRAQHLPRCILT